MALSNAERQRNFRRRRDALLRRTPMTWVAIEYRRLRAEVLSEWLKDADQEEKAVLLEMANRRAAGVEEWFTEAVFKRVGAEYAAAVKARC